MDTPRSLIVGYDLGENITQISCYSYKTMEPIPIGLHEGEEDCPIPTVLCVKKTTKQWLFGEEAITCAESGAGILIDHLLEKLKSEEELEIYGSRFTPVVLLEKYLRKTLTLIKNYFPTEQITKLVVTARSTEPAFVDKIYEAFALLGLNKDRVVVMSHAGAYLYYALSQDRVLWQNDVGLFDFDVDGLCFYKIHINRRVSPAVAGLEIENYCAELNYSMLKHRKAGPENGNITSGVIKEDTPARNLADNNLAYILENTVNRALYKQIITTLYFTGSGFEGNWADTAIKNLCTGRRVFLGQNLYTKGACYAAKELSGDHSLNDFILLSDDMITSCVMIRVYCDAVFKDVPLLNAGENWYEVNKSIEVISEGEAELEIIKKDIMTRDVIRNTVLLDRLPVHPDRTTRLLINLTCRNKSAGTFTVTDLGFGEFYPGSGQVMEFSIEL